MGEILMENYECLGAELSASPAKSLLAMVQAYGERIQDDELTEFADFLQANQASIDAEAEGSIVIKDALGEDGFAYYQKLETSGGHGRLTQWPVANGWSENGYTAIQEYNSEHGPVFETIWDDEALKVAVEQDGTVMAF